jgi:hypothetical protein
MIALEFNLFSSITSECILFTDIQQLELLQRERSPTERDQVEALILSLVDRVSGAEKFRQEGGKIRDQSWHVASK